MGFEPITKPWKGLVLPLHHARTLYIVMLSIILE